MKFHNYLQNAPLQLEGTGQPLNMMNPEFFTTKLSYKENFQVLLNS